MAVLVLAEHDHRSISAATLNTCSAAKALAALTGGGVAVLVAGENCDGAAKDAAGAADATPATATITVTAVNDAPTSDTVAASGAITCILVGSFRCRYREGFDKRVPLVHGEPTALHFRLSQVAYTFPIGSRVALMVTPPRINPVSMSRGQLVDINQARLGTAPRIGMLPWAPTATGPF